MGENRSVGFEILFLPFMILFVLLRSYPIPTLIGVAVLGWALYTDYRDKHQVVWTNSGEIWRISGNRAEIDPTISNQCLKMMTAPAVSVERDLALVDKKAVTVRFQLKATDNTTLESFRFGLKWTDATGKPNTVEAGASGSPEEGSWQNVENTLELPMKVDSAVLFFSFAAPARVSCWINDLQIGIR